MSHPKSKIVTLACLLALHTLTTLIAAAPDTRPAHTFAISGKNFVLDGKPVLIRSGEMHYPRTPHQYWRDRLRKAKAMGLNTICTYVFWNVHEARKGEWNFTGDADIAAFCRMAQEEGLWVIVRPGPYVCAEWDFGGYPSWLLADRTTKVRTNDPKFLAPARDYILKVGEQLRSLQITYGGPIIMVQVENEYGSFDNDTEFLRNHQKWLREAGFDVPLFTSDGPQQRSLTAGTLPDVLPVVNFGNGAAKAIAELKKFCPGIPQMVGEFWVGWFDAWGKKHNTTNAEAKGRDLQWLLENDVSVNFYMFAGGTNYGFMAGANGDQNRAYAPDITSYDYSAILDEAGNPTDKYWLFREILAKKFFAEKFPEPPVPMTLQTLPAIVTWQTAPLLELSPARTISVRPETLEEMGGDYGLVHYQTEISGGKLKPIKGLLDLGATRDYAIVMLDGKRVGTLDRRLNQTQLMLDVPAGKHRLELTIENQARINFGRGMLHESKGLVKTPTLDGKELEHWETDLLLCERATLDCATFSDQKTSADIPEQTLLRSTFTIEDTSRDTYLDMRTWSKGIVWVNGHNLGRFWKIGPQQALYLPGCWLQKGENEIIVLTLDAVAEPVITGITAQIWETKADPSQLNRKPGQELKLDSADIVTAGRFANGDEWQTIAFDKTTKGRYLCLEALNAFDGKDYAAIAELIFTDAAGKDIPREQCTLVYADGEELTQENGSATNVLDNQPTTCWHTPMTPAQITHGFPHQVLIDLGAEREISGLRYLPRQGNASGRIKDYCVYIRATPFAGL